MSRNSSRSPGEAGPRLRDRLDHLGARAQRPGALAVAEAGGQEQHRDDDDEAVHERRGADDRAGLRVAQRSTRQDREQGDDHGGDEQVDAREPQAALLGLAADLGAVVGRLDLGVARVGCDRRVVGAEPALDHARGHDAEHEREQDRRSDAEPQVRRQVDRLARRHEVDRLVGDLGEHRVGRRHQQVDAETACDTGERGGHAGERMPADAQEGRGPERDEHEIAGVGGDARDDAEEHDDVGERRGRRRRDELADQCRDEAGALRDAHADHHDEDDPHRGEAHEVGHERREQVADAVDRQQPLDRHRLGDDLVVARRGLLPGQHLGRQHGPGDVDRRDALRGRLHDLVRRTDARPREQLRQHDHAEAQREEHDRRVGTLLPTRSMPSSTRCMAPGLSGVLVAVAALMVTLRGGRVVSDAPPARVRSLLAA